MEHETAEGKDLLVNPSEDAEFLKKTNVVKNADAEPATETKTQFIQLIRPLLVELIGTAVFILIGLWGTCSGQGVLAAALSFGFTLMVLTASFGHISGAHFNPSVTVGVLIAGEIQPIVATLYVVVQLLGGIAAAGILRLLVAAHPYEVCKGGATFLASYAAEGDSVRAWQGIIIEFFVTFLLVTVLLMVALDTKSKSGLAPLIIGFAYGVSILAIGAFTGGSLNPARSLGPAIFFNFWQDHFVYWIGPLVGAIVAGLLYRLVWAHHDRRLFVKRSTATPASKA